MDVNNQRGLYHLKVKTLISPKIEFFHDFNFADVSFDTQSYLSTKGGPEISLCN